MTDKELVELAAKTAGVSRSRWDYDACRAAGHMVTKSMMWNPLDNDATAFNLAIKLELDIEHNNPLDNSLYVSVSCHGIEMVQPPVRVTEEFEDASGRADATRRAIVRAAAALAVSDLAKMEGAK